MDRLPWRCSTSLSHDCLEILLPWISSECTVMQQPLAWGYLSQARHSIFCGPAFIHYMRRWHKSLHWNWQVYWLQFWFNLPLSFISLQHPLMYICMHTYICKHTSVWCSIFGAKINTSCPLWSGSPECEVVKFSINKYCYIVHKGEKRKMFKWRHISISHLQSTI